MKKFTYLIIALSLILGFSLAWQHASASTSDVTPEMVALGKAIFFDPALSANGTQSCAACHAAEVGFTGPDSIVNKAGAVYQGALPLHFGNRKPPSAAYAGDSPNLHFDEAEGAWFGGMFWDGRATGDVLGDPLVEQAQGPFLNPLEQAVANPQVLCQKVRKAAYAGLYEQVWGNIDCAKDVEGVYANIARAVAAYEESPEVNPFTSQFDMFWENARTARKDVTKIKCGSGGMGGGGMMGMGCPGGPISATSTTWANYRNLGFTDQELQGLAVFNDPNRGNCASCHTLQPGPEGYPLFTDFGYDNIGIPKNPENPFYSMAAAWNPNGANWVDYGLGAYLKSAGYPAETYEPEMGKFKVPTLRNVDLRPEGTIKAYGHNGYFKSLEDLVFFYHWRAMMDNGGCMGGGDMGGGMGGGMNCDGMAGMFPAPEVDQNRAELGMFPRPQVDNIVSFLKTLSDGYFDR